MADTGKDHRHVVLIGSSNYFFVANGTTRLNSAGCTAVRGGDQPIREWKKGIARDRAAFEREPGFVRFPNGNARSIDTRHLPGANAKGPIRPSVNDRI